MTAVRGARAPGALLYSLFTLALLGGTAWWLAAAPTGDTDPRTAGWRAEVLRKLPESDNRTGGTIMLSAGSQRERVQEVTGGSYLLSVVCAGPGRVRISLSTAGRDSGRGLDCATGPDPIALRTALGDQLNLRVTADDTGPVVVRWVLQRISG